MRRVGGLWRDVIAFDNLLRAAQRAAQGKRHAAVVARFMDRREFECLALQRELLSGAWRPGRPNCFRISDPKERLIVAAPFRDRVVHHALIDILEPHLDRRMIHESFACRRGKGTHAALDHAQRALRAHEWFLKMDVRHFFGSLRHSVVADTIARVIKDRRVLDLVMATLGDGGVGLPIGSLTSQWFANMVLSRLDHRVKQTLRVPGYVRYMDDMVLFHDDRDRLRYARGEVEQYLGDELGLALKERATILAPARCGLPFLGWRLYGGTRRLRPENLRRTRKRVAQRLRQNDAGLISDEQLAAAIRSVTEHLSHGSTRALRRSWFHPP